MVFVAPLVLLQGIIKGLLMVAVVAEQELVAEKESLLIVIIQYQKIAPKIVMKNTYVTTTNIRPMIHINLI